MTFKENWQWTKYDSRKFELVAKSVPVQFGHVSRATRRCYLLGIIGTLNKEPFKQDIFFRIHRGETGAGRIFVERMIKRPDGRLSISRAYIPYSQIPEEIKNKITKVIKLL